MHPQPPKWALRFLRWYCNPDLLEEIQGDTHELYLERLKKRGKSKADFSYVFDVLRFFRWSNIRRSEEHAAPGFFATLLGIDLKIARRNASRNKLVFSIKMISLAICMAFALLLSAFVIQEYNYDQHLSDSDRIYRVAMSIDSEGYNGDYGLTPIALANELKERIPEIESVGWASDEMFNYRYVFSVNERNYIDESALIISQDFLEIMDIKFIRGNPDAFLEFDNIIITESIARRFFGFDDPIGQTVEFQGNLFEVSAIIEDPPSNSHLDYGILMSWEDFDICECWNWLDAITYIKLNEGANIHDVQPKIQQILDTNADEIATASDFQPNANITLQTIIENVRDIHLNHRLDFDTSKKISPTNLEILTLMAILFFLIGFINFLNLSLAEMTTHINRIAILRFFGGATINTGKIALANTVLFLIFIAPVTLVFILAGLYIAKEQMDILIVHKIFTSNWFLFEVVGCFTAFLVAPLIVGIFTTRWKNLLEMMKGRMSSHFSYINVREILVGVQLSSSIIMLALIIIVLDQFQFLSESDKGFEDKSTLTIRLPTGKFSQNQTMLETVRKLKGVKAAGASSLSLDEIKWVELFEVETKNGLKTVLTNYEYWGDNFTAVLGFHVVQGRDFGQDHKSDVSKGYLVNETAVQAFGWTNPIGMQINDGQVIGVVKDFQFSSLYDKITPLIILHGKRDLGISEYLYVKIDPLNAREIIPRIEDVYHKFYFDEVFLWEYMDERIAHLYKEDRQVQMVFKTGFIISILLSCMGVLSISILLVLLRAKEMSIRKVAGAGSLNLYGLHIKKFMVFTSIAFILACPLIYFISSYWLDNFAYRIDLKIAYFIFPGVLTFLIVLFTSGIHGLRNVNVIEVLNGE